MENIIPAKDLREFLSLPPQIQAEVESWARSLLILAGSKPILPAIAHAAKTHKVNASSVYRKRRDFDRYGWRGLINRAKYPANPPPTSGERFLRFIHRLWLANDKNYKNTHLQLMAIWKQKAPIPGYDYPPAKSNWNDCPDGWTYCNIIYHIKNFVKNHP
jgi:hypothetical protein